MRYVPITLLTVLLAACARQETVSVERGREVVHGSLCMQCHGPELNGTTQGPPLQGLAEHWTEERLMRYLEDPAAMIETDPRLQAFTNTYRAIMPQFTMDETARRSVAKYLLNQPEGAERGGKP